MQFVCMPNNIVIVSFITMNLYSTQQCLYLQGNYGTAAMSKYAKCSYFSVANPFKRVPKIESDLRTIYK